MDFKEKRVIITGASSGIGLALAREFARRGARVVMGARSGEKLEAVEKSEEYLFSLGFTDFRVRLRDGGALLQFTAKQQEKAQTELEKIKAELSKYFGVIKLDPKARAESQ